MYLIGTSARRGTHCLAKVRTFHLLFILRIVNLKGVVSSLEQIFQSYLPIQMLCSAPFFRWYAHDFLKPFDPGFQQPQGQLKQLKLLLEALLVGICHLNHPCLDNSWVSQCIYLLPNPRSSILQQQCHLPRFYSQLTSVFQRDWQTLFHPHCKPNYHRVLF
jgi:hypothetical protein